MAEQMISLQSVLNVLCHHCLHGVPFEDAEGWKPFTWHEWIQDGRHVGRLRCNAADMRHQLQPL